MLVVQVELRLVAAQEGPRRLVPRVAAQVVPRALVVPRAWVVPRVLVVQVVRLVAAKVVAQVVLPVA